MRRQARKSRPCASRDAALGPNHRPKARLAGESRSAALHDGGARGSGLCPSQSQTAHESCSVTLSRARLGKAQVDPPGPTRPVSIATSPNPGHC